jgi:predicted O-methyltransferase YrrM
MTIRRILQRSSDGEHLGQDPDEAAYLERQEEHREPWMDDPDPDRYGSIAVEAVTVWEAWQRDDELAWLLRRIEGAASILEVGRARGGTLWAVCQVALADARITSIDSWAYTGDELSRFEGMARPDQALTLVRGDSVTEMERLRHRTDRYDVILIDADHERVFDDWNAAQPLAASGCIVGFHDIYGVREHTGRVPELWQLLRRSRDTREYCTNQRTAIWGGWGIVRG